MSRITQTWQRLRAEERRALILYLTVGFPDRESALELVPQMVAAGADMVELGVPFSDPLAEGSTIQGATQRALQNGVTVSYCLETVRQLRAQGIEVPLLLMGYLNPLLRYGVERFCTDAAVAGVDGLILPDLPPEEAGEIDAACRTHGLDLIMFVAPTSTPERIAHVAEQARGFIYCVALKGVTGARAELPPELPEFVTRVRQQTSTPVAVGFGISQPEHAQRIGALADGVIIGSKLIDIAGHHGDVAGFVRSMRNALD